MSFFHNAWKALDGFGQEAGKRVGSAAHQTFKHLDAFGQDAGRKIGPALGEAWKHMDAFGQEAGKHTSLAAERTKQWVEKHPGETAGIVACVVAAPIGIGAAYAVLNMVGFTATGVAAGSAAAAAQSGIGSVAAGSTFAVLQSAAAGGAGATLVSGVAGGTATGIAVAATTPGLIKAIQEGKKEVTIDDVTYKIEDKEEAEPSPPAQ
jgi:ElaB/YqjD/DUF883 family membrane-anchored ribosome-binding protein